MEAGSLAGKWHAEAATLPLTCLLLSQLRTTSTLPSLVPGTLPQALYELSVPLKTHEFPEDSSYLHLASPQSSSILTGVLACQKVGSMYLLEFS